MTYKGIFKMLTADLSTETPQARREWQDIFKVMKEKKCTTKIILLSKDLIQIWKRNQMFYRQSKSKRIQHHHTSFLINAKGMSLDKKDRKGL